MQWEEMKANWQALTPDIDPPATEEEIVARARQHALRFERRIRIRDWLETIAAIIVTAGFGYVFTLPDISLLSQTGILLVLASCAFIIWRLHSVRMRHPREPDCAVADLLRGEIHRLDEQIRLLSSVSWWYLAPLGTGVILVVFGIRGWSTFSLLYAAAVVALYAGIYYLNRRAVQRELQPRRQELSAMLASITSTEQLRDQQSADTP